MNRRPQIALLADGKRLHLQDGPIDLIVEASGREANMWAAYEAAARRFTGLLDELCAELAELRKPANPERAALKGVVARRMHAAVAPFAADCFITPMAAVAGSVAEEILGAMLAAAPLGRAYVNNGGDIALHLTGREQFTVGLMDRPDAQGVMRTMTVDADDPVRQTIDLDMQSCRVVYDKFAYPIDNIQGPLRVQDGHWRIGKLTGSNGGGVVECSGAIDPSKAREALAFALFREAGVPAPRTALAEVTLSVPGRHEKAYLGLYTLVEPVDRAFLKERFCFGPASCQKTRSNSSGLTGPPSKSRMRP